MKLIAVLCWFDEQSPWLTGAIGSLKKMDVAHVVAVDGAYGLYPNGRAYSSRQQHATIVEACHALEMGSTIYAPREPYIGNEVEKRSLSLRLAEAVAEPYEDWYFITDADHFVESAIGHQRILAETDCDVAEVSFQEPYGSVPSFGTPLRCVFRAIPGLTYVGNHYTPVTPDGKDLHHPSTPAENLSCVQVEHRTMERDSYRKISQQGYYHRRELVGAEYEA